ncbi:DUF6527 family protein [Bradyrhizobium sp. SSUT77]|uniref:DUF6527 family protein n=1 Tax=Bradyrhizobium sp. SSUT77 TaxID=3040603 RepID=UPI0024499F8A|nr:DUF6527 family protein [Bradyrhizobium sp. SSUT77]MDH2348718.1 DUF6527 family protein [Bradyrhizobium sp. SSUT77]
MHLCCCGCGREVVTPLAPAQWRLTSTARIFLFTRRLAVGICTAARTTVAAARSSRPRRGRTKTLPEGKRATSGQEPLTMIRRQTLALRPRRLIHHKQSTKVGWLKLPICSQGGARSDLRTSISCARLAHR